MARPRPHRRLTAALILGMTVLLGATACTDTDSPSDSAAVSSTPSDQAERSAAAVERSAEFPVTVSHAFGETTVEQAPMRVATVGWANHEVPLSLGIVPVGMSKATWGDDDDNGILPWVEDRLTELDAEPPVLFDETDALPFEQIADTRPDVILAAYSGMTREEYDQLSKIAPVVAYPDIPWGTSLEDMVTMDATALGLAEEGAELNATLDAEVTAALDKHPELADSTALFTSFGGQSDTSTLGFYATQDPRAGFLADAGLGVPAVVRESSRDASRFWVEHSAEDIEAFEDVSLMVSYGSDDPAANAATLAELQADPLLGRIPAIRDGHVAFLGSGPLSAAANPSPLALTWGVDDYFTLLAEALR